MGPVGNVNMADEMGKPSNKMIAYYLERAKGGVGLITSGMIPVSMDDPSYGDLDATGIFPRIDAHRSSYSGWRSIVEGCHAYGAKFFVQLAPGMGRVGNPECLTKKYKLPVSSSWQKNWYIPEIPCRPLGDLKINSIIRKTAQVAADCKSLGVDGVYLHGHSGYLIEQMTDTAYNKRKLGKYTNYQTFGIELIKAIRKRVGLHYRIDLSLALKATYKDQMKESKVLKGLQKERSVQMTLDYMENLVKAGVDMFDVDLGGYENWWLPHPPNGMPPGTYLEIASLVKSYFKDHQIKSNLNQNVPIVAVGKLGNPDLGEKALREGICDMVMLSRPLLADPDWPNKVYADKVSSIIPCIGDHEGCLGQLAIGGHPHCAVNPRTAFEDVYSELSLSKISKKILVIGAGPAGVTAATTLCDRGHEVTLVDEHHKAGGMLLTGGVPKIKYEIQNYVDYLNHQLSCRNIHTIYNTKIDEAMIKAIGYDIIITSTGSKPIKPPVAGVDKSHVVSATEFLADHERFNHHKSYVVIGGADVGCEVAHMISYEFKKKVTLVEMGSHLMPSTCTSNRHFMIHHLHHNKVEVLNATKLLRIEDDHVVLSKNKSKTVPDPSVSWTPLLPENIINPFAKKLVDDPETIRVDSELVILATGARSNDALYDHLKRNRVAKEIINIGDSSQTGRVLEAVKAGYRVGRTL
jgi:2-enoate reductase